MEVSGQLHAPAALPPGKDAPIRWEGVDFRAGLDAVTKIKKNPFPAPPGNRTSVVQPVR